MRASTYLLPLLLGCTALAGCVVAPTQGQLAPGQYATNSDEIREAPPPLQEYEQPPIPAEGYVWTPPFWQYGRSGYYWVPGVWVEPPSVGLLWTPGYWGFSSGYYRWNAPYWGASVGYYGGINYGYGYFGNGYDGGRWDRGRFHYNQSVNNFGGRRVTNYYNAPVENRGNGSRTSFNGGTNGVRSQPGPGQNSPGPDQRRPPTAAQTQHFQSAQGNTGFPQRGNQGATPGGQINRPGGQPPQPSPPQRQNFGQQPNYAPAQQQDRPAAQAPQVQQRPQPVQQMAPARQAPAAVQRPQQRPEQQTPPPPRGQRPQFGGPERP